MSNSCKKDVRAALRACQRRQDIVGITIHPYGTWAAVDIIRQDGTIAHNQDPREALKTAMDKE